MTRPEWDGADYAANTGHHRATDEWFFSELPLRPTDRVLDIGCGSGDFTRLLADRVPDGHVVGLEPQPTMLDEARRRAGPNQSFVEGPAQRVGALLADEAPVDLVVSRAVLHWIPAVDHPGVYSAIFDRLRPGGWLRIEHGGHGNVAAAVRVMAEESMPRGGPECPWHFPSAAWSLDALEAAGFEIGGGHVRTVAQHRPFTRDELIGWLHSQTLLAYEAELAPEHRSAFRAAVDGRVEELRRADGTYDQTWVRLDALVRRPG